MLASRVCVLIAAVVCAVCAGCGVQSVQPLSDPAEAKVDDRLPGVWKFCDASDLAEGDIFLHVGRGQADGKPLPAGVLPCLFVQHNGSNQMLPSSATMFTTTIGERNILNLRWETDSGAGKYAFFKYEFKEGDLQLFSLQSNAVVEAVRRGELEGTISNGVFGPRVALRDTSDNLFKFCAHSDDAALFGDTTNLNFTRISD